MLEMMMAASYTTRLNGIAPPQDSATIEVDVEIQGKTLSFNTNRQLTRWAIAPFEASDFVFPHAQDKMQYDYGSFAVALADELYARPAVERVSIQKHYVVKVDMHTLVGCVEEIHEIKACIRRLWRQYTS